MVVYPKFYCVYEHILDGKVLYVGKGRIDRAFSFNLGQRREQWLQTIGPLGELEVRIAGWYPSEKDALAAEGQLIKRLQPIGNVLGRGRGVRSASLFNALRNREIACYCGCGRRFLEYDKLNRRRRYIPGHQFRVHPRLALRAERRAQT